MAGVNWLSNDERDPLEKADLTLEDAVKLRRGKGLRGREHYISTHRTYLRLASNAKPHLTDDALEIPLGDAFQDQYNHATLILAWQGFYGYSDAGMEKKAGASSRQRVECSKLDG